MSVTHDTVHHNASHNGYFCKCAHSRCKVVYCRKMGLLHCGVCATNHEMTEAVTNETILKAVHMVRYVSVQYSLRYDVLIFSCNSFMGQCLNCHSKPSDLQIKFWDLIARSNTLFYMNSYVVLARLKGVMGRNVPGREPGLFFFCDSNADVKQDVTRVVTLAGISKTVLQWWPISIPGSINCFSLPMIDSCTRTCLLKRYAKPKLIIELKITLT